MEKFNEQGQLVAGTEPKPSAGAFEPRLVHEGIYPRAGAAVSPINRISNGPT